MAIAAVVPTLAQSLAMLDNFIAARRLQKVHLTLEQKSLFEAYRPETEKYCQEKYRVKLILRGVVLFLGKEG